MVGPLSVILETSLGPRVSSGIWGAEVGVREDGVGRVAVGVGIKVGREVVAPVGVDPSEGKELGANVGGDVGTMAGGAVSEYRGMVELGGAVKE